MSRVLVKAGDYHDIYLKTDVLLLADIFQNFQQVVIEKYDLTPFGIIQHLDWHGMHYFL
jgi:hypothetical protein